MTLKRSRNPWPRFVILLGAVFLALTGWSVQRAATGVSAVTDPAYFAHGLKYNDTLAERRAAESLGWRLEVELGEGELVSRLIDRAGLPVSGGTGRLVLRRGDRPGITLPLREKGEGLYSAALPADLEGEFTARLIVNRHGASLRRALLLNL